MRSFYKSAAIFRFYSILRSESTILLYTVKASKYFSIWRWRVSGINHLPCHARDKLKKPSARIAVHFSSLGINHRASCPHRFSDWRASMQKRWSPDTYSTERLCVQNGSVKNLHRVQTCGASSRFGSARVFQSPRLGNGPIAMQLRQNWDRCSSEPAKIESLPQNGHGLRSIDVLRFVIVASRTPSEFLFFLRLALFVRYNESVFFVASRVSVLSAFWTLWAYTTVFILSAYLAKRRLVVWNA
jgi:hypothetical protein